MKRVVVTGSFDDFHSRQVRFLDEAAKLGAVQALLWPDETVRSQTGKAPKFPVAERLYVMQAMRYVSKATVTTVPVEPDALPPFEGLPPEVWVVDEASDNAQKQAYCAARGIEYRVLKAADLKGFPVVQMNTGTGASPRKKVLVTGCYDWFHSGHVRFFEEVSGLGDLYVVVGSDQNVKLLKGEGHPMFSQDERRYMAQAVRYVTQALVSTGTGWMDAEPEIAALKPDIYAVNEDGDKPEKQAFCKEHNLEYVVLKRTPAPGLPRRQSTDLRGF